MLRAEFARANVAFWGLFSGSSKDDEMNKNVEIKARVRDPEKLEGIVYDLTESLGTVMTQMDVFFRAPNGRLKLRIHGSNNDGELIYYQRSNVSGPKTSEFSKTEVNDANSLKLTLSQALGVLGTVRKQRRLYIHGQTRIHLDDIEGLGTFMELEVMMESGQKLEEGEAIANDLMKKLEIDPSDLVPVAYIGITHKLDEQFVKHEVSEFSMGWNPNVELSSACGCALSPSTTCT